MKYCEPLYFKQFKCVADQCEDTCCKFWQVELDEVAYKTVGDFVLNNRCQNTKIKKSGKEYVIVPCKNNSCPFLESSLLCSLYKEVGHDRLPKTCQLYPRFFNAFGGYEERGLSFSCPTAAKIIYNSGLKLYEFENSDPITSYTSVDAERFKAVKFARDSLLAFIGETDSSVEKIIYAVIQYAEDVQNALKKGEYDKLYILKPSLSNKSVVLSAKNLKRFVSFHLGNTVLKKEWKTTLKKASINEKNENIYAFKVWFNYFNFRYLIRACDNLSFKAVVIAAIISFWLISSLETDFAHAMQKYSKEVEHCKNNIDRLLVFSCKFDFTKY